MYKLLVSFLLLAFLCVALAQSSEPRLESVPTEDEAVALFREFKVDFERAYATAEEEASRFELFKATLKQIVEQNKLSDTATFGISNFADMTREEKNQYRGGMYQPEDFEAMGRNMDNNVTLVDAITPIDWRNMGVVTPVKNQKNCGDCWAFAATEMVETAWALAGHGTNILAPQQILDCCNAGMCNGCRAGNPMSALFDMIQDQNGELDYESSYPYIAKKQPQCGFRASNAGATIKGVNNVYSESALYTNLQKTPVIIMVDADSFHNYKSGYLTSSNCQSSNLNHFIQVVGIQYWSDGTPVYIARNQWGTAWANYGGYMYIAYNQQACGLGKWGWTAVV